jgi:hypothetical protein
MVVVTTPANQPLARRYALPTAVFDTIAGGACQRICQRTIDLLRLRAPMSADG